MQDEIEKREAELEELRERATVRDQIQEALFHIECIENFDNLVDNEVHQAQLRLENALQELER